jgi:hypothetical protein
MDKPNKYPLEHEPKYDDAPVEEPNLFELAMELLEKEKLKDTYFRLSFAMSTEKLVDEIVAYMNALETGETRVICYCAWVEGVNNPVPRIVQEHPLCRLHSKEGRILGFLMYWAKGCLI